MLGEEQQIGRNDPCWCGSGKKFKKCHGAQRPGAEDRPARVLCGIMVTTAPSESTPQRLAAIREQMKLLADYL